MNKKIIILITIGVIILVGIILIPNKNSKVANINPSEMAEKGFEVVSPIVHRIEVGEKGFSPQETKGQIGSFIEFVNKTKSTVKIEFLNQALGFQNLNLSPNETSRSTILNQAGIYKYKNADDPDKQGLINIK